MSKLQIKHANKLEFEIIQLIGDFTQHHVYPVRKVVLDLIETKHRRFAIDMEYVTGIDFSGTAVLMQLSREIEGLPGGVLFIFGCPVKIQLALEDAHVTRMIRLARTFEEGLRLMSKSQPEKES